MTKQEAESLCSQIQLEDDRLVASVIRRLRLKANRGYKVSVRFPFLNRQVGLNSLEEWRSIQDAWRWFHAS